MKTSKPVIMLFLILMSATGMAGSGHKSASGMAVGGSLSAMRYLSGRINQCAQ